MANTITPKPRLSPARAPIRRNTEPASTAALSDVSTDDMMSSHKSPSPKVLAKLPEQAKTAKAAVSTPAKPEPLDLFLDVVTMDIMSDPVFCDDGHSYDRTTAEALDRSPFTRLPLHILGANVALRSAIWGAHPEQRALYVRPAESSYTGDMNADGLPHSEGKQTFVNGTVEEGRFDNGTLQQGARTLGSGDRNFGTFVDGALHGEGVRTFAIGHKSGQVHTGSFEHGELRQGTIEFPNGSNYVGALEGGKKHGQGIFTWANGNNYVGAFEGGKMHGQGVYTWANGSKFVGAFEGDKRNGQGVYTSANGIEFVGAFEDDKMRGQGVCTWADGTKYVGAYEDSKMHGQGVCTWRNGGRFVGLFINGERERSTSSETNWRGRWNAIPE